MLQDFDAFYTKVLELKAHTLCIYSNLTHYREVVIPRLHPNSIKVICSLDSGTPETYKKIKGRDLFHEVVENIKKYCSIEPDAVFIKYLFCDSNFSIAEVDSFFEVMQYCGVKNVRISLNDYTVDMPDKDYIDTMVYFIQKAKKLGFSIDNLIRLRIPEIDSILPKHNVIDV